MKRPLRQFAHAGTAITLTALSLILAGCGGPNRANIELRKQNQELRAEIDALKQQLAADRSRLIALENKVGTTPTLPQERLDNLFTVHDVKIGRLTGGTDLDPKRPGDEALKVYLTPVDQMGDPTKAPGKLLIEAFSLSQDGGELLGRWEFSPQQVKDAWRGLGALKAFVFTCPWQKQPSRRDVAVKISFEDALTGRTFPLLHQAKVNLPEPLPTQASSK